MTLAIDLPWARNSPWARLDPRWRLAAIAVAVAVTAVLQSLAATAAAFLGALLAAGLARLPLRWYLKRLASLAAFLALLVVLLPLLVHNQGPSWHLGPVRASQHGLELALVLCLKGIAIMTLVLVLLATAPLQVTFQAAHALRVPGLLVHLALLTYRYVFLLGNELARLRVALRVRGYRNRASLHSYRTLGHVAGTLLVRSSERAERVGQAMRCRGFAGRFRSLAEFRTRPADWAVFLLVAASALGLLVWDLVQR